MYTNTAYRICGIFAIVCRQTGFPQTEICKVTAQKAEPGFIATANTFALMNLLVVVLSKR